MSGIQVTNTPVDRRLEKHLGKADWDYESEKDQKLVKLVQEMDELTETGQHNLRVRESILTGKYGGYTALPTCLLSDKRLSKVDKVAYWGFASFVQEPGRGRCFPHEKRVAKLTGLSERSVQDSKTHLAMLGYMDWVPMPPKMGKGCAYRLFINVDVEGSTGGSAGAASEPG